MLFRRRYGRTLELMVRDAAVGRTADVDSSVALAPPGYPVSDVPNGAAEHAERGPPTRQAELRGGYQQARQFKPAAGRLARNFVIGNGATKQVLSPYSNLRTQIVGRIRENDWNTVAVTSPSRKSGNTLTAINLAISMARDFRYTVVLVELDLINPSFRQVLGFDQQQGIVDHLLRDVPIQDILLSPGIERLIVVPAGSPATNSSELLCSPKMTQLVAALKLRYEHPIILFDLPSVLAFDDAMAFSPLVDCALLVVKEGETRINDVRRAMDNLRSTKILGVAINRSIHVENNI
jgi:protein-tyrosine kinase